MPRHPKQNEYERRSRLRRDITGAALFNGWSKLDVLSAFTADDGSLMIFDTEGNRYVMAAESSTIEPVGMIQAEPSAPVVSIETGRPVNASILPEGVDPSRIDTDRARQFIKRSGVNKGYRDIRKYLVAGATEVLAALHLLDTLSGGPDWQDELDSIES